MHVCSRDGFQIQVDVPTYDAVVDGSCVPACGVDTEGLRCYFSKRLFGEPYISDEVEIPIEAPDSEPEAPPSAQASYPDYEPTGEPSMEEYEIPASEPNEEIEYSVPEPSIEEYYSVPEPSMEEYYSVPEPSMEEYYSIPEPSLEEYSIPEPSIEEYSIPEPSIEEYSIPEPSMEDELEPSMEAPVSSPASGEIYSVDIPVRLLADAASDNEIFSGGWSDCSQHCAQAPRNGTRVRVPASFSTTLVHSRNAQWFVEISLVFLYHRVNATPLLTSDASRIARLSLVWVIISTC